MLASASRKVVGEVVVVVVVVVAVVVAVAVAGANLLSARAQTGWSGRERLRVWLRRCTILSIVPANAGDADSDRLRAFLALTSHLPRRLFP